MVSRPSEGGQSISRKSTGGGSACSCRAARPPGRRCRPAPPRPRPGRSSKGPARGFRPLVAKRPEGGPAGEHLVDRRLVGLRLDAQMERGVGLRIEVHQADAPPDGGQRAPQSSPRWSFSHPALLIHDGNGSRRFRHFATDRAGPTGPASRGIRRLAAGRRPAQDGSPAARKSSSAAGSRPPAASRAITSRPTGSAASPANDNRQTPPKPTETAGERSAAARWSPRIGESPTVRGAHAKSQEVQQIVQVDFPIGLGVGGEGQVLAGLFAGHARGQPMR